MTRERQAAQLQTRERRRESACDPQTQRALDRGWEYLDELEACGDPMSHAEIAASLGLSREAVRQIEARALRKLRDAGVFADWEEP